MGNLATTTNNIKVVSFHHVNSESEGIVIEELKKVVLSTYVLAGIKKDLKDTFVRSEIGLIVSNLFFDLTNNKSFKALSIKEVETAFKNGISNRYREYGEHNFSLPYSAFIFFLDCYLKDKEKNFELERRVQLEKDKKLQLEKDEKLQQQRLMQISTFVLKILDDTAKEYKSLKKGEKLCFCLNSDNYTIAMMHDFFKKDNRFSIAICQTWIDDKVFEYKESIADEYKVNTDFSFDKRKGNRLSDITSINLYNKKVNDYRLRLSVECYAYIYLKEKLKVDKLPFFFSVNPTK